MIPTKQKKIIGILTGGGDVPGLNPAIGGIVKRANNEGFKVIGIKRGYAGLVEMVRNKNADNSDCYEEFPPIFQIATSITEEWFLHSSRTNPEKLLQEDVPDHLKDKYSESQNDVTPEIIKNIEYLQLDYLVVIGGNDTLKYSLRLHKEGIKIIAIPKTMDGDVSGTDYCIGFSTCITRIISMILTLSMSAGSHERFLVIEVFGRSAGFTAMLPTIAGVANRCVIPESEFNIPQLAELMVIDRAKNPGKFSTVVISEGAKFKGMTPENNYRIGEKVAQKLHKISTKFNNGKKVDTIVQNLGYLVRSGVPDATDSIVPIAYGNIAMDIISDGKSGMMTALRDGVYTAVDLNLIDQSPKTINVEKFYDKYNLQPKIDSYMSMPQLIINGTTILSK